MIDCHHQLQLEATMQKRQAATRCFELYWELDLSAYVHLQLLHVESSLIELSLQTQVLQTQQRLSYAALGLDTI